MRTAVRPWARPSLILLVLTLAGTAILLEVHAARERETQEEALQTDAARQMKLSEEEWRQYRSWRELIGAPLNELTPYEVLGMYADDPQVRRHYALQNARFMLDFYRRSMAFEALYREEMKNLTRHGIARDEE